MTASMRVVVVGQGYVGLPLGVAAAQAGHVVVGVDADKARVDALNRGVSPIGDVADEAIRDLLAAGRYAATDDFSAVTDAEIVVLCVPTPYHGDEPDLSFVESAGESVGQFLRPGALVILESTTYPGTTEEVLLPLLERASGMRAGDGFGLVFSPERIDPGNPRYTIHNTPKIVGGIDGRATDRAAEFYGSFVDQVVRVSGPKTAEMAKLLENTFRHINIALVNELAILSQGLGVDVWEVIDAAASKPFGFMPFYPGPGVGGHCIPVDPMYLSWRVRQFGGSAKFIELARDVNAAMPLYCVSRVQELLNRSRKALNGSTVFVLGVAYKPGVSDKRESPAIPFMEALLQRGALVIYHDPHVPELRLESGVLSSVPLSAESLSGSDCAVVITNHTEVDYDMVVANAPVVFDTRNAIRLGPPNVHRL